jgi:hypothetical protein
MNWDTAPQELDDLRVQVTAEQLKAAVLRTEVNELRRERAFNERLARDLAAMTKERDRWQEDSMRQAATINRMSAATEDRNEVDQFRHAEHEKELAAAQVQIAQLREALETISDGENWGEDGCWESSSYPDEIAMEALAIPTDTTALDARLAQERERCAVVAEKSEWIAAQIRSMK